MKHHDDRQWSLFGEPQAAVVDEPEPPQRPKFDATLLMRVECEDEDRVTATSACSAMHYGSPHHFREFVKRLDKSEQWGSLSYRTIMITAGKGARRSMQEPLLTEKQLIICCMRSDQRDMASVRSLIADVFIAWRHGRLRAADAHTEASLEDATDRAFDEFPALFAFCREIQETGKAARAAAERAARAAEENITNQRRYPEAETVRGARWVNKHNYRDHCPCCERVWLGPNGGVWAHMKGKFRRTIRDGWFVCEKCNLDWENPKNTIEINIKFVAYVGHVEAYLAQGQFHFGRKT